MALGGSGAPYKQAETVLDATYLIHPAPSLAVQPDLQLVVNPGAGVTTASNGAALPNALIFGARFTVNF